MQIRDKDIRISSKNGKAILSKKAPDWSCRALIRTMELPLVG